ncbi:MAG: hypothetical protein OXU77_22930 [Gammaproteobacteria bacterium]|nr:hypothetical protein [Gammaproteobacteria bacterium]
MGLTVVAMALGLAPAARSGELPIGSDEWERADKGGRPTGTRSVRPIVGDGEGGTGFAGLHHPSGPTSRSCERAQRLIRGEFTRAGQIDIAVLCSCKRVSTILVFRGGSTSDIAEIARLEDRTFLQDVGGGRIGYSRLLGVADADFIRGRHAIHGGLQPPPLDHEGINDIFVEKASRVWYWYEGRWRELTGSD